MKASLIVLTAMIVAVAALAVYRNIVARREDDQLHIADPTGVRAGEQRRTAERLRSADRIGVALTVATAVFALVWLGFFLYA